MCEKVHVVRVRRTEAKGRFGFFDHSTCAMSSVGVGITKTLRERNLTFASVRLTRTIWTFFKKFFLQDLKMVIRKPMVKFR